ncbi:MAG: hypothetical protein WBI14_02915 [Anaerolineaceae bacterium]
MVKRTKVFSLLLVFAVLAALVLPIRSVFAQDYRFSISRYEVEAYIESDGTLTLKYLMAFDNSPQGAAIEFVDLGLPYADYDLKNVTASINDEPVSSVNNSAYVHGAELALGSKKILPGQSGVVTAVANGITGYLTPYDIGDKENYANFFFQPSYFDPAYDKSNNTEYRMTIILPPAVSTDQGVYYTPEKFPETKQVEASTTTDGRVFYSWFSNQADTHTSYQFGAAFPNSAVPSNAIAAVNNSDTSGSNQSQDSGSFINSLGSALPCCIFIIPVVIIILVSIFGKRASDKRKMDYLPPKISIEGQGIKRGLTAVEAGILMEQPIDRILTMILFSTIKKGAVMVATKEPLEILVQNPLPEGLYPYELDFIKSFGSSEKRDRRRDLQSTIIDLVKDVTDKMKGFSKAETIAYYKDIVSRAWSSVEGAETPEVKMEAYDKALDWTMLDKDYNERTERTFTGGPVILPTWWGRYDPVYRTGSGGGGMASSVPSNTPATGGSSAPSMPKIPGADFAASMINNASAMTASVIGGVGDFTGGITNRTNPIPVQPSSGGGFRGGSGGGTSCACACACAGCACACAGGGR